MKKLILILVILLFFLNFACADIIPPNSHFVSKCVTINNIDSFNNYVIIGKITGPMRNTNEPFEINVLKQNVCLNKGYKFNQFDIYAIKEKYYEETNTIDFNSKNVFPANIDVEPYEGYIHNSNPITKIEVILTIKEITNKELILETVSEIKTPTSSNSSQNIFESIICFFKVIFGMSC